MPNTKQNPVLDAQKSVEQTASVMEHLFRAPQPLLLVFPILIVSLFLGLLVDFNMDDPLSTFFVNGVLILALPTYLSGVLSVPLAESLGGKFYLRRSMLLSFLCLLIIGGILLAFRLIMRINSNIEITHVLIFGYSAIIWLRHLILVSTSQSKHLYSLPASLTQPVFGYIMIAVFLPPFGSTEVVLILIFQGIFLSSVLLLTRLATTPMRRAFGVNGLSMLRYSLDHITEGGDEGAKEVEDFFKSFAQKMDVHVGIVAFKKRDGVKCTMIVPSMHPGPFGMLGGSDLPRKLTESLSDKSPNIMVPHGSATHDLNLSTSAEKNKIADTVKRLLENVEYSNTASRFTRIGDSMNICAQVFGNGVLLVHTSAPNPTDDVDYSTGSAAREKVHVATGMEALFIDAHNWAEKGSGCVYFGSKEAYELIDLSETAAKKVSGNILSGIRVGYAGKTGYETQKGIGTSGIQVMVMEIGGQKTAYILFDGNNMEMGLRDGILKDVGKMVDEAEVLTTDNHAVNATIGGFNPVGLRMDKKSLIKDVRKLVVDALNDLEDVTVGMKTGYIKNLSVFGHENVTRLSSTVNSTMAIMKITTFASLLFAVMASTVIFLVV